MKSFFHYSFGGFHKLLCLLVTALALFLGVVAKGDGETDQDTILGIWQVVSAEDSGPMFPLS